MKEIEFRFIISSLLIIVFLFVSVTGVALLFDIGGSIGILIKKTHTISGILMILLVIIHLILNYKMYVQEGKLFFSK